MDTWSDGPNADRNGMDYLKARRTVTSADKVELKLAPGGGFAAKLTRE